MGKAPETQIPRTYEVNEYKGKTSGKSIVCLRNGSLNGPARALGRSLEINGSWMARNPVGASVGRWDNVDAFDDSRISGNEYNLLYSEFCT